MLYNCFLEIVQSSMNFVITNFIPFCRNILLNKNYKLYHRCKEQSEITISQLPTIEYTDTDIDYNNLKKCYASDCVIECANRMINVISKENLKLFYNNINGLTVVKKNFTFFNIILKQARAGDYSITFNRIRVRKKDYERTIPHELFHLASAFYDFNNKIVFSGFLQYNYDFGTIIGRGLNEGYTQVIKNRYFGTSNSYVFETHFASLLDEIIGKDRMENLYLNANLYGLVEELKKYANIEDIMRFINSFDYINLRTNNSKKIELIKSNSSYIARFLVDCYMKKLKILLEEEKITVFEMYNYYADFLEKLNNRATIGNKIAYVFFELNDLKRTINDMSNYVTLVKKKRCS